MKEAQGSTDSTLVLLIPVQNVRTCTAFASPISACLPAIQYIVVVQSHRFVYFYNFFSIFSSLVLVLIPVTYTVHATHCTSPKFEIDNNNNKKNNNKW